MNLHITPTRIYNSHWEFAHQYLPRLTAFSVLLSIVRGAVAALVVWLAITDVAALLTTIALIALWLMIQGTRR